MNLRLLQSTGFLIGLSLLLANDFIFKYAYPGWLTGKLSDFAGLFIFPIFWTAIFETRKTAIHVITLLGFVWWKSPLADSFIYFWNDLQFFSIHRVVDYSDYLALAAIPAAWMYAKTDFKTIQLHPVPIALFSVFAFTATSAIQEQPFEMANPIFAAYQCDCDSLNFFANLNRDDYGYRMEEGGFFNGWGKVKLVGAGNQLFVSAQQFYYFEQYEHAHAESGRTRFLVKLNQRKTNFPNILNQEKISVTLDSTKTLVFHFSENSFPEKIDSTDQVCNFWMLRDSFQIHLKNYEPPLTANFKEGILHGKFSTELDSFGFSRQGFFENGKEIGRWQISDSLGNIVQEEFYQNGFLTQIKKHEPHFLLNQQTTSAPRKMIVTHVFWTMIFLIALIFSLKYFWKNFQKNPKNPVTHKFVDGLLCLAVPWFVIPFALFGGFWIRIGLEILGWDLPIDLFTDKELILNFILSIVGIIYMFFTRKYLHLFWLTLWSILINFILHEIEYIWSLIKIL